MGTARMIRLIARSGGMANLAFPVGGIVLESSAQLGDQVQPFDLTALYGQLGVATEPPKVLKKRPSPLRKRKLFTPYLLDSGDLDAKAASSTLMRLRAEAVKAMLDKGCAVRANLYINKYGQSVPIIAKIKKFYSGTTSKGAKLALLSDLAVQQEQALTAAYTKAGMDQVVQDTKSLALSTGAAGNSPTHDLTQTFYTGYTYRHPSIEAVADSTRAQVNLNDERFADFLATLTISNLEEIFGNELLAIDMDVKRFQVAYINTFLFPSIAGVITAIYKAPGEAVLAGETVLRIENHDAVNVAGTIIYNDLIKVGDNVTINTSLFDGAANVSLTGSVVVARGAGEGTGNRWHVVFSCSNLDASNNHIVPLNYSFSDVDTTITFA